VFVPLFSMKLFTVYSILRIIYMYMCVRACVCVCVKYILKISVAGV
jgi:hypothetical protein